MSDSHATFFSTKRKYSIHERLALTGKYVNMQQLRYGSTVFYGCNTSFPLSINTSLSAWPSQWHVEVTYTIHFFTKWNVSLTRAERPDHSTRPFFCKLLTRAINQKDKVVATGHCFLNTLHALALSSGFIKVFHPLKQTYRRTRRPFQRGTWGPYQKINK